MNKFTASMFCALRAAECVIVDGNLVRTFQLHGSEGGSGILNLEDGSTISFANQDIALVGGYGAFQTEAEKPHSIDFITPGGRGLSEADVRPAARSGTERQTALALLQLRPAFRFR
ncbi:hypothetical protein J7E62_28370 [Variovorax paradoxus]|nr:hypothetical protein [Variovorax paradoxus]